MSPKNLFNIAILLLLLLVSCNSEDSNSLTASPEDNNYNILSLGDSYTIGESVCNTCKFPEQLKDSLIENFDESETIGLKVIAQTGWTTTNLKSAIESADLNSRYDLVTLLIGVNNQFQGKPFSIYEEEFPELVNTAISLAGEDKSNLIVVSIPDYAFTPFGQNRDNPENISAEIDSYNDFAKNYCEANDITFVNITDITREGLNNTDLVATDGLHPSELAYSKFVERLLPIAMEKIE
ncbi:SGNH/GDSL hydrolase family protein [Winogradskyella ursingii]|uniref:SGNH/GDSL hydrolase family protein n=1 Tax=Winogradskyella ursingii TaxID=2686079 RepID=UPI0015CCB623|nr:SGNH/GDSL hydrolase family protein [Winogradskyella ursingii]